MARLRNESSAQPPATKAPTRRAALREKTNTTHPNIPVYENDGNTEGLVKDAKPKRGRPKKMQQEPEEYVMAGGLGPRSDAPASDMQTTTDELAKSDAVPQPPPKANRRPPRTVKKIVQSEEQAKVLEGLKELMEATAREKRAKLANGVEPATSTSAVPSSDQANSKPKASRKSKEATERSEFSLSPSPPPPGKLNSVNGKRASIAQPGSAMKVQNTPTVETSIMALKNFKRRPRQPSMLQMVQQRTASARPSITNTSTAMYQTAAEDQSVFDLDLDTDEEDDFAPEAEGTPLNARKPTRLSSASNTQFASARSKAAAANTTSIAKKRKSDNIDVSSGSLTGLRSKRQKPAADSGEDEESIVVAAKPAATRTSSVRAGTPQPLETSDVQVANSPSSTPPTEPSSTRHSTSRVEVEEELLVPSTEREGRDDEDEAEEELEMAIDGLNGTMAEPISSSPARITNAPPSTDAPPMTQVSPAPAKSKPTRRRREQLVATSTLQSLLPKRRQPLRPRERRTEYNMESDADEDSALDASHLEEDEDELGGSLRRPAKTALPRPSRATGGKGGRPGKATKTKSDTAKKKASTAAARKATAAAKGKKVPKTYGRAPAASDKENDEDYESPDEEEESTLPEISISMDDAVQSRELEDAKKRFAEVDDWDMEFESMSQEFHRSSSQEWR